MCLFNTVNKVNSNYILGVVLASLIMILNNYTTRGLFTILSNIYREEELGRSFDMSLKKPFMPLVLIEQNMTPSEHVIVFIIYQKTSTWRRWLR